MEAQKATGKTVLTLICVVLTLKPGYRYRFYRYRFHILKHTYLKTLIINMCKADKTDKPTFSLVEWKKKRSRTLYIFIILCGIQVGGDEAFIF